MKSRTKKAAIISGIIIIALIVTGVIFMFGKAGKSEPVTSCESLTLHLSGMRITEEYEIKCDGETAEISHYYFKYSTGEETRELQSTATCPAEDLIAVLNECNFMKWDGFYGKHPKYVTDGTMFSLDATVNGGTKIHADGSENFPKNYHTFTNWLYEKTAD